ncbi:hypothetical protein RSAG8_03805, partial [Rhizoctonia solani AG-8 WAC10335]
MERNLVLWRLKDAIIGHYVLWRLLTVDVSFTTLAAVNFPPSNLDSAIPSAFSYPNEHALLSLRSPSTYYSAVRNLLGSPFALALRNFYLWNRFAHSKLPPPCTGVRRRL